MKIYYSLPQQCGNTLHPITWSGNYKTTAEQAAEEYCYQYDAFGIFPQALALHSDTGEQLYFARVSFAVQGDRAIFKAKEIRE